MHLLQELSQFPELCRTGHSSHVAFVVYQFCCFRVLDRFDRSYWEAAKRVRRYLKGTRDLCLMLVVNMSPACLATPTATLLVALILATLAWSLGALVATYRDPFYV